MPNGKKGGIRNPLSFRFDGNSKFRTVDGELQKHQYGMAFNITSLVLKVRPCARYEYIWGIVGLAPFILHLVTRWKLVTNFTASFTRREVILVPTEQESGYVPERALKF
jgi:hypothetical protein